MTPQYTNFFVILTVLAMTRMCVGAESGDDPSNAGTSVSGRANQGGWREIANGGFAHLEEGEGVTLLFRESTSEDEKVGLIYRILASRSIDSFQVIVQLASQDESARVRVALLAAAVEFQHIDRQFLAPLADEFLKEPSESIAFAAACRYAGMAPSDTNVNLLIESLKDAAVPALVEIARALGGNESLPPAASEPVESAIKRAHAEKSRMEGVLNHMNIPQGTVEIEAAVALELLSSLAMRIRSQE